MYLKVQRALVIVDFRLAIDMNDTCPLRLFVSVFALRLPVLAPISLETMQAIIVGKIGMGFAQGSLLTVTFLVTIRKVVL